MMQDTPHVVTLNE